MLNAYSFISSLEPEKAKEFALEYFRSSKPGEQEKIVHKDILEFVLRRYLREIDKRFQARSQQVTLAQGENILNTGLANLGDYVEVYATGTRLYQGVHYTITSASLGQITLVKAVDFTTEFLIIDAKLNPKVNTTNADTLQGHPLADFIIKENFTTELLKMRRYDVVDVVGGATEVSTTIKPMSGRPTVIINGKVAVQGKDFNFADRSNGVLTIINPPSTAYVVHVEDMVFGSGQEVTNTHTIDGVDLNGIVRGSRIFEFTTMVEAKAAAYLKANDRVRIWGEQAIGDAHVSHYIVTATAENNTALNNGLFLKDLSYYIQSDSGTIGSGENFYISPVLKDINAHTEVYVEGKRLTYGVDWSITSGSQILLTTTVASPRKILMVDRDITYKHDLTLLNGFSDEKFVKGERVYELKSITEMKTATYLKINDRVTVWGNTIMGDAGIADYLIVSGTGENHISVSNGLFAKPMPALGGSGFKSAGVIPTSWYNTNTSTLDMHGCTHGILDATWEAFAPVAGQFFELGIVRIINVPAGSTLMLHRKNSGNFGMTFMIMGNSPYSERNLFIPGGTDRYIGTEECTVLLAAAPDMLSLIGVQLKVNQPMRASLSIQDNNYTELLALDTPRHATKMKEQGIYDTYMKYLDGYEAGKRQGTPKKLIEYLKSTKK